MQGIHAWCPGSDACISLARDARVNAGMSCSGRVHVSFNLLWPAVLVISPLCNFDMFMCMSYDWGITVAVHMHRGPIMFYVQFVICLNWTRSTLERSHAFVIGDATQVQRRWWGGGCSPQLTPFSTTLASLGFAIALHRKRRTPNHCREITVAEFNCFRALLG